MYGREKMKIVLDLENTVCCIFVNYVASTKDGMVMGSKSYDTKQLMAGEDMRIYPSEMETE